MANQSFRDTVSRIAAAASDGVEYKRGYDAAHAEIKAWFMAQFEESGDERLLVLPIRFFEDLGFEYAAHADELRSLADLR